MLRAFRTVLLLAPLLALGGCYLDHGVERDVPDGPDASPGPGSATDGGLVTDAGRDPSRPREIPPDASIFVPEEEELPIARPSEALTCDNGHEVLVERCGALRVVHVAEGGRPGATGSAADPLGSLEEALQRCDRAACELRLARGALSLPRDGEVGRARCLWVSGGWERSEVEWTASEARTRVVVGALSAERLVVERIDFDVEYSAASAMDLLVVRDVSIVSGYEGLTAARQGTRVCRTSIVGAYSGISVSWGSSDVVIEDVDIEAGYSGVGVSWGSSSVVIRRSRIRAGYVGVDVAWESHDVAIEESEIDGGYVGVDVNHGSSSVLISDSLVGGCHEPVSVSHGSHSVKVTNDTVTGPCAGEPHGE